MFCKTDYIGSDVTRYVYVYAYNYNNMFELCTYIPKLYNDYNTLQLT